MAETIFRSRLSFRASILPALGLAVTKLVSDRRRPPNTGMLFIGTGWRSSAAHHRAGRLGSGCGFQEKVCELTDHLLVLGGKMQGRSAGRRRRLLLLQIAIEPAAEDGCPKDSTKALRIPHLEDTSSLGATSCDMFV